MYFGRGINDSGQVAGAGRGDQRRLEFGVVYDAYGPNAGRVADTGGYGSFSSAINNVGPGRRDPSGGRGVSRVSGLGRSADRSRGVAGR